MASRETIQQRARDGAARARAAVAIIESAAHAPRGTSIADVDRAEDNAHTAVSEAAQAARAMVKEEGAGDGC